MCGVGVLGCAGMVGMGGWRGESWGWGRGGEW